MLEGENQREKVRGWGGMGGDVYSREVRGGYNGVRISEKSKNRGKDEV